MDSKKTALVVDDSKSARFAMRKFLEGFGYSVESAGSAQEALASLDRNIPDVVFLDHIMPSTDGFDALKLMRAQPRLSTVPVILCSSDEDEAFLTRALNFGALDVLQKPPSPERLEKALASVRKVAMASPLSSVASLSLAPGGNSSLGNHKVHPIRDPEIAIQQAVMKTLRDKLPEKLSSARVVDSEDIEGSSCLPPAHSSLPDRTLSATFSYQEHALTTVAQDDFAQRLDSLNEEMDSRLRRITQDLFVQIGETRAQVAHLESALRQGPRGERQLRELAVQTVRQQLDGIVGQIDAMGKQMRNEIDEVLRSQNSRIEQLAESLRVAVVEEAHAVSERVVMNAAARISDQIADSLLKVLKTPAASKTQSTKS